MTNVSSLNEADIKIIDDLVDQYKLKIHQYERLAKNLFNMFSEFKPLMPLIHSLKYRVKDPEHLRRKLRDKFIETYSLDQNVDLNKENLFDKITDLAGVRILHLHTDEIADIDIALKSILDEEKIVILEGPIANTWDIEYENFYKSLGMEVRKRDSLYTSVHYLTKAGNDVIAEIQIRTLFEEVWGEVSHKINYPEETKSIACNEQIKVLARITSSGTRLVDSIFKSYKEFEKINKGVT